MVWAGNLKLTIIVVTIGNEIATKKFLICKGEIGEKGSHSCGVQNFSWPYTLRFGAETLTQKTFDMTLSSYQISLPSVVY